MLGFQTRLSQDLPPYVTAAGNPAAATGINAEVARLVEQIHQRALQTYGPKSGEMSVVKLFEEASGTQWRLPPQ